MVTKSLIERKNFLQLRFPGSAISRLFLLLDLGCLINHLIPAGVFCITLPWSVYACPLFSNHSSSLFQVVGYLQIYERKGV